MNTKFSVQKLVLWRETYLSYRCRTHQLLRYCLSVQRFLKPDMAARLQIRNESLFQHLKYQESRETLPQNQKNYEINNIRLNQRRFQIQGTDCFATNFLFSSKRASKNFLLQDREAKKASLLKYGQKRYKIR